jgi:hypothetical protein
MVTLTELLAVLEHGNIWQCPPITDEPEYELEHWAVFEVKLKQPGSEPTTVTRHVAGDLRWGREAEGKVSSPIVEFDPASASFRTRSGRVYRVRGKPGMGFSSNGCYVWGIWLHYNPSEIEPRDVSIEVAQAIALAQKSPGSAS